MLLTLLIEREGRCNLVAPMRRGTPSRRLVRHRQQNPPGGTSGPSAALAGWLVPFLPLQIIYCSSSRNGVWPRLLQAEPVRQQGGWSDPFSWSYRQLACALYLNELLYRLLKVGDSAGAALFGIYQQTLAQLAQTENSPALAAILRPFERQLLAELGYGIDFTQAADGQSIRSDQQYHWRFGTGFETLKSQASCTNVDNSGSVDHTGLPPYYPGAVLTQIAQSEWNAVSLSYAKRLFRRCLRELLGDQPLLSRQLLRKTDTIGA